ncbi:MAG: hypothetical protein QHH25_07520 [Candidatus Acetothermia bacterium]|nr:hypothetical protein [Candidatus Acetothermia bacterium]
MAARAASRGMQSPAGTYPREDGGWRAFWAEGSDPAYSVIALELLVQLGVFPKEKLQARLRPFCS